MSTKQEVVARLVGLKLTDEQANKVVEILKGRTKFYDEGEVYNEEEEKDECEDDGYWSVTITLSMIINFFRLTCEHTEGIEFEEYIDNWAKRLMEAR